MRLAPLQPISRANSLAGGLFLVCLFFCAGCARPPAPRAAGGGGAGSAAGASAAAGPRPVLLTTDAGCEVDDQWALAMLVLASEEGLISLEGIVTTHAPKLKPPASTASLAVCREVIGVLRPAAPPPVVAGSSEPLREVGRPQPGLGPEFIVELSRRFKPDSRLTVLAIGAATDVASALLIDPLVAGRIEVVAMAFEGWPGGGDPWNVKNDPLAYRVILGSGVPLTIGPADVCLRRLTVDAAGAARKTRGGGTAGKYLESKLLDWLGSREDLCRKTTGRQAWPIWDLITVAQVLGLTRVEEYPRPGLRDDLTFEPAGAPGKVRWIADVDEEKLWGTFRRLLESRKSEVGSRK